MTLNVPFRVMVVGDGRKGGILILSHLASDMSRELFLAKRHFLFVIHFPFPDQSGVDKQLLVYFEEAIC